MVLAFIQCNLMGPFPPKAKLSCFLYLKPQPDIAYLSIASRWIPRFDLPANVEHVSITWKLKILSTSPV